MASNHVPSDQMPLQDQSIYTDASPYGQSIFSSNVDRYEATPSWDAQLNQHAGLAPPHGSSNQWHQGSIPQQQSYNSFSQPYGTQGHALASPYRYNQFGQQGSIPSYAQPSNVDPSLGLDPNALRHEQHSPYPMPMRNASPQTNSGTITPQALQQNSGQLPNARPLASPYQVSGPCEETLDLADSHFQLPRSTSEAFAQRVPSHVNIKPVPVPTLVIPRGKKSGGLYVLDQAALGTATKSTALNKLVNFGIEPFHLPTNRSKPCLAIHTSCIMKSDTVSAALPLYTPRQSVKELKKAGADNKKLLAKLSSSKPSVAKALKTRAYAGSPSSLIKAESDSGSYTDSSDDDSEYTDDDDEDEVSPLPAARPDEPHEAVRYDIIKATWCPRDPGPRPERIKEGLKDIWEVLGTIQKRWRADSTAVTEAEKQKKTGELPVLKSRVASQRDLLQSALEAALKHAHPDVLWHLGSVKSFVYLCYQFLANRFHSKDFDGPLSAAIYEVLSRCGTLTSEILEETKAIKALTSMKKHANDKHKALIQKAIDNAVASTEKAKSEKAKSSTPPRADPTEPKGAKRPATEPVNRTLAEGPLAKKFKAAEGPVNGVKKTLVASTTLKTTTTPAGTLPQKKPMATPAPVKARINQVANKPSGIFASLNAASKKTPPASAAPVVSKVSNPVKAPTTTAKDKKPTTAAAKPAFSFSQTMASLLKPKEQEAAPVKAEKQLPPETPEEKAKRLRKEARRHLRVTFKPDTALVQIKYFSHDPEEELGHDENFVRHAGDIEGEGRMFKQHKELEVDEDEEDDEREAKLKPWRGEPSQVDFDRIPDFSRQQNFAPFGGAQNLPSCPEKEANIRRENATLMVFYADPRDIPSSPREPLEQAQNDAPAVTIQEFGTPLERTLQRASRLSAPAPAPAPAPMAVPDFSGLEEIMKQFATPTTQPPPVVPQPPMIPQNLFMPTMPPAPPTVGNDQLQSLLQALQSANQAPVPVQAPVQQPVTLPNMPPLPTGMDVSAIMAMAQASGVALPPPPFGVPPPFWPPPPLQQQDGATYQQQQQPQYNAQLNGGAKRPRDDSNNNDWGQSKKHKHRGDRPHKVLPCKFFQKGTCNKGDNCTYVHDLNM